jgi:hypothetical protein
MGSDRGGWGSQAFVLGWCHERAVMAGDNALACIGKGYLRNGAGYCARRSAQGEVYR